MREMRKQPDNCSPHGWTLDTLEKHLSARIDTLEKYLGERLEAAKELVGTAQLSSEKALTKAEAASEKRQDAANEIRAAMMDQQKHFADRDNTDFRLSALEKIINMTSAASDSKSENLSHIGTIVLGAFVMISTICSVAGLIVTVWHR